MIGDHESWPETKTKMHETTIHDTTMHSNTQTPLVLHPPRGGNKNTISKKGRSKQTRAGQAGKYITPAWHTGTNT